MYSVLFRSRNKAQPFDLPGVFDSSGDKVDTCSFDTGVPQHIRQLRHIPAGAVEGPREQVPQIVGKDF